MEVKKRVGSIVLATGVLFSGVLDGLVNLNKDEKANNVRQGVFSEWKGIPRGRAEEVESLEEFVEEKVSEENNQVDEELVQTEDEKKTLPFPERYPEFAEYYNIVGKEDMFKGNLESTMAFYAENDRYVYEKEFLNSEGETCVVQALGMDEIESNFYEGWILKGKYVFNPDDCIYYFNFTDREDIVILSTNDVGTIAYGLPNQESNGILLVFHIEDEMKQGNIQSLVDQVSSGSIVQNLIYETIDLDVADGLSK